MDEDGGVEDTAPEPWRRLVAGGRLTPGTGLDLRVLPPPTVGECISDDVLTEDRG